MDDPREGARTLSESAMFVANEHLDLSLFAGRGHGVAARPFDAAVLWRRRSTPSRPGARWRGLADALRPSSAPRRNAPTLNPFARLSGWSSSGDGTPQRWVGFHRALGVVRVGGHDYPVRADAQTLVLLAAEAPDGSVTVQVHARHLSAVPAYQPSLQSAVLAPLWAAVRRQRPPTDPVAAWLDDFTTDPVVAAFLASRVDHGAT